MTKREKVLALFDQQGSPLNLAQVMDQLAVRWPKDDWQGRGVASVLSYWKRLGVLRSPAKVSASVMLDYWRSPNAEAILAELKWQQDQGATSGGRSGRPAKKACCYRAAVMALFDGQPGSKWTGKELADALGISISIVSNTLGLLKRECLVESKRGPTGQCHVYWKAGSIEDESAPKALPGARVIRFTREGVAGAYAYRDPVTGAGVAGFGASSLGAPNHPA